MKEDELRKSIRREKLQKQGLSVSQIITATAAPITSDDEDDVSTPSGDNAERSLASTLGGSSESIQVPRPSTFLQVALDGPGSDKEKDRGERRKKITIKFHESITFIFFIHI
jgi:mitogen-activated protein kinase binding protein 1